MPMHTREPLTTGRDLPAHLREAYRYCGTLARSHHENFPVASLFVPKGKRPYVWSIYAFARTADDFADEGSAPPAERLRRLAEWQERLDRCTTDDDGHPVFTALGETLRRTGIPHQLLSDLLTAFRMDVTTHSYRTFDDLLGYCRYSANPVGRLVLHLFGTPSERAGKLSDLICTALQLANFWQDVGVDRAKGRLYLPLDDCDRFGYNATGRGRADEAFRRLMEFQVDRTRRMFEQGRPLIAEGPAPIRFELALTWHGGVRILDKIVKQQYDVLDQRPALTAADKLAVVIGAIRER